MGLYELNLLNDTLNILNQGYYDKNNQKIKTKLTPQQREECIVYLPSDIESMLQSKPIKHHPYQNIKISCENIDSFSMAIQQHQEDEKHILVLNFANPVNPGGGVRRGAKAQEEDLCRKSSLLFSLESKEAQKYYQYNKSLYTYMGSDAMIIHPNVEIIKDVHGDLLDEPIVVSVLTCAAPMICYGIEGTQASYEKLFYQRIDHILKCAAYLGYTSLVLGAFGCGAFKNDASLVSSFFYQALSKFHLHGLKAENFFKRIDFAVLDKSISQYNYLHFHEKFDNYYQYQIKDKMQGCLMGGAIGDALGYPIEFMQEEQIFSHYGHQGISEYEINPNTKKAIISDDTQMTLFTANGLLVANTQNEFMKSFLPRELYVQNAYLDWYDTQTKRYDETIKYQSWLCDISELFASRAPGTTCMSALYHRKKKHHIPEPINDSKGCGGVMRIAPIAFYQNIDVETLDKEACNIAGITHGHSLAKLSAALLCHILHEIIYHPNCLKKIVIDAKNTINKLYYDDPYIKELNDIIDFAIQLSENNCSDLENIKQLGEGWVSEEALAIAIYCSLKYQNDFSKGIIAAVNHSGDSDSTGSITGNILGAFNGYANIEDKWKNHLELSHVICEISYDLYMSCCVNDPDIYHQPYWKQKYMIQK